MTKMINAALAAGFAALASLGTGSAFAAPAAVVTTFNFNGICSFSCSEPGIGTLTLQDYTLGQNIMRHNFVSLVYSSGNTAFTLDETGLIAISGRLGGEVFIPYSYSVDIWGIDTNGNENFLASQSGDGISWNASNVDGGTRFAWTSEAFSEEGEAGGVPEPASWAMMLAGFGLVGEAMRRRKVAIRFA